MRPTPLARDPRLLFHWGALPFATSGFFLILGYELIRSSAGPLFLEVYGSKNLPLVMAAVPFVLLPILHAYNGLLSMIGPRKTLLATTLLSSFLIVLCCFFIHHGFHPARAILWIIREIYVMVLVEQYWSFINSAFDENFAKKFNGAITGISSMGAIIAGVFVGHFAVSLGSLWMPLLTALILVPLALLTDLAYRKCGEPESQSSGDWQTKTWGLNCFRSYPVLKAILALVILSQVLAAILELRFQTELQLSVSGLDAQTAFSGKFYALLNTCALLLQFVVAPLVLKVFPLHLPHLLIPLIHVLSGLLLFVHPTLSTAALALLLFKSLDYSFFRITKEILYVPLSFDSRYRAKELIDVLGYRSTKGLFSIVLIFVRSMGGLTLTLYTTFHFLTAVLWGGIVLALVRKRRLTSQP